MCVCICCIFQCIFCIFSTFSFNLHILHIEHILHILHILHSVHILNMYFPGFKLSDDEEMPEDVHHNLPPQDTKASQKGNNG